MWVHHHCKQWNGSQRKPVSRAGQGKAHPQADERSSQPTPDPPPPTEHPHGIYCPSATTAGAISAKKQEIAKGGRPPCRKSHRYNPVPLSGRWRLKLRGGTFESPPVVEGHIPPPRKPAQVGNVRATTPCDRYPFVPRVFSSFPQLATALQPEICAKLCNWGFESAVSGTKSVRTATNLPVNYNNVLSQKDARSPRRGPPGSTGARGSRLAGQQTSSVWSGLGSDRAQRQVSRGQLRPERSKLERHTLQQPALKL